MKHTNQEDSNRNQTVERDQQGKTNNAHTADRNETSGQQNRSGKKDHPGKQGNDQSNWQSDKKEHKK
jgi:hypothetical protein